MNDYLTNKVYYVAAASPQYNTLLNGRGSHNVWYGLENLADAMDLANGYEQRATNDNT